MPVHEVTKPAASASMHEVTKPADNPAANNSGKPLKNHRMFVPRTLIGIESYSGYKSVAGKIDKLVKEMFSAGKQMKLNLVCEEGLFQRVLYP